MAFFHVDLWSMGVQEYLVLTGTDDVAGLKRFKWDFHVPCSDAGERKKSKNCFSQFRHHIQRFWPCKCRRMGTNKENTQHCHQVCLETVRLLGQEVFGSELNYQRTVECSLFVFFLLVILGT